MYQCIIIKYIARKKLKSEIIQITFDHAKNLTRKDHFISIICHLLLECKMAGAVYKKKYIYISALIIGLEKKGFYRNLLKLVCGVGMWPTSCSTHWNPLPWNSGYSHRRIPHIFNDKLHLFRVWWPSIPPTWQTETPYGYHQLFLIAAIIPFFPVLVICTYEVYAFNRIYTSWSLGIANLVWFVEGKLPYQNLFAFLSTIGNPSLPHHTATLRTLGILHHDITWFRIASHGSCTSALTVLLPFRLASSSVLPQVMVDTVASGS